jgi:hypothetical protein
VRLANPRAHAPHSELLAYRSSTELKEALPLSSKKMVDVESGLGVQHFQGSDKE